MRNLLALTLLSLATTLPVNANTIYFDLEKSDPNFRVQKVIDDIKTGPDGSYYRDSLKYGDKQLREVERDKLKWFISMYDCLSKIPRGRSMAAPQLAQEAELAEQLLNPENQELRQAMDAFMHHVGEERSKYVQLLIEAYQRIPRSRRQFDSIGLSGSSEPYSFPLHPSQDTGRVSDSNSSNNRALPGSPQAWNMILVGLAMSASTTSVGLWLRKRK